MIGFKKTPVKLVIGIFLISIFAIVLLYVDSTQEKPKPIEQITISEDLSIAPPTLKNKLIHEVNRGESLSIIFEEEKLCNLHSPLFHQFEAYEHFPTNPGHNLPGV